MGGRQGLMNEGVNLVVFLPEDPGVVRIGAEPLDTENRGPHKGVDVFVDGRIRLDARLFRLLDHFLHGTGRLERGRAIGEIHFAPGASHLFLQAVSQRHGLADKARQVVGVKIDIRQG